MTIRRLIRLTTLGAALTVMFSPSEAKAQGGPPYTLDQVERLVGRLSNEAILARVSRDCLSFTMDSEAEGRLRSAGADEALIEALRGVCYRGEEPEVAIPQPARIPPPPPRYNPWTTALRSLAIPGLGQLHTGRPAMGALFFAAWAGAIGYGVADEEVTVECLARTSDACPPGQVRGKTVERPMLVLGLGTAAAVAVISALEARWGANKANARQIARLSTRGERPVVLEVLPVDRLWGGRELVMVQIRF